MKTLVIKKPGDCPYNDPPFDGDEGISRGVCNHQNFSSVCETRIPPNCPLREGLKITVEEE